VEFCAANNLVFRLPRTLPRGLGFAVRGLGVAHRAAVARADVPEWESRPGGCSPRERIQSSSASSSRATSAPVARRSTTAGLDGNVPSGSVRERRRAHRTPPRPGSLARESQVQARRRQPSGADLVDRVDRGRGDRMSMVAETSPSRMSETIVALVSASIPRSSAVMTSLR